MLNHVGRKKRAKKYRILCFERWEMWTWGNMVADITRFTAINAMSAPAKLTNNWTTRNVMFVNDYGSKHYNAKRQ